jgi:hypothetical protein
LVLVLVLVSEYLPWWFGWSGNTTRQKSFCFAFWELIQRWPKGFVQNKALQNPKGCQKEIVSRRPGQAKSPFNSTAHSRVRGCSAGRQHNCLPRLPKSQELFVGKYHLPLASGACDDYPETEW